MKLSAEAYLNILKAGTIFRSNQIWSIGQSWKTITIAHGNIYNNKLTVKNQEVLQIIQLCYISIQFMGSCLDTLIELSFAKVIQKSILALLFYSIF